ncbi:MAG: bacterioferritin [Candidatus Omnitrophica bacterium CG11_big_fil_rev_8_21_14_0_20_63_9]|nr:MAG: bacterioferritin [Candidatus Omnitrophica bacterium CG11_big_fil_rev_8_21_14_0_20_63_9]
MGQLGREIIKDVDVKAVIKELKAAYADEWLAHYNYLHAAQVATGLNAPPVASMLTTRAADELMHAMRLSERIQELGGALPEDWAEIPKLSNTPKFVLPKNTSDMKGLLKAVLKAERSAITTYQKLSNMTRHRDTVTHELAEELLADEVKDEEHTENLIGE